MNNTVHVKLELSDHLISPDPHRPPDTTVTSSFIDLLSSDSDSSSSDDDATQAIGNKRRRIEDLAGSLPLGFLDPLPQKNTAAVAAVPVSTAAASTVGNCKQFWKAGDYEGTSGGDWGTTSGGMDHVRVHPKFLHSNATSHKWVFGAFAELLDNSLDEVCNGATFAKIDVVKNHKDGSRMLFFEDNGGGMNPEKMRHCMSLGYSVKSKIANTIGQYGNGFKTSTMRLGADVIVFSRCCGENGKRSTQSIGLLSYTFLRTTGKEDIIVPMLDYEREGREWKGITRTTAQDRNTNMETIVQWSPFSSEDELLRQFTQMKDHGTRIFVYNLWEDDEGQLELDFDTDPYDIQRGVSRDETKIQMAKQYPNSKHFLTYQHSLRSYASILYLRIPSGFRIILRGKDVEHHNVINDMMMSQEITYRPNPANDGVSKDSNMVAVVTVGFVKDAKFHIDVQGFNVYHKNRLIKPFWRIWNAAGSDGRGVIGVLEANFVEPAHDKQGFERTIVLSRLESKLIQMQKTYWTTRCHEIGYAPRRNKKQIAIRESSPEFSPKGKSQAKTHNTRTSTRTSFPPSDKYNSIPVQTQNIGSSTKTSCPPLDPPSDKYYSIPVQTQNTGSSAKTSCPPLDKSRSFPTPKKRSDAERDVGTFDASYTNGLVHKIGETGSRAAAKSGKGLQSSEPSSPSIEDVSDDDMATPMPAGRSGKFSSTSKSSGNNGTPAKKAERDCSSNGKAVQDPPAKKAERDCSSNGKAVQDPPSSQSKEGDGDVNQLPPSGCNLRALEELKEENRQLRERLAKKEEEALGDLLRELQQEKDQSKSLQSRLDEANRKIDELNKEQESLIDIFSEERQRRALEEETLRKRLKESSSTIQELLDKVRLLEKTRYTPSKLGSRV